MGSLTIAVNSNGYAAIGNRYFGSKNAESVARAYGRLSEQPEKKPTDISAGNRQGAFDTVTLTNGLRPSEQSTVPKSSSDIYTNLRNILQRMREIATTVVDDPTLTDVQRAQYDTEYQSLREALKNNGAGRNPTTAATENPAGAALENLELVGNGSNVYANAQKALQTELPEAERLLYLQQGGAQQADLENASIKRQAYFDRQKYFDNSAALDDLRAQAESASSPLRQAVGQYNPRIQQNSSVSSILSLLA